MIKRIPLKQTIDVHYFRITNKPGGWDLFLSMYNSKTQPQNHAYKVHMSKVFNVSPRTIYRWYDRMKQEATSGV